MRRRRQSGFTLIELMVTLVVVVILATLAVPSFATLIEKSRLRGATDDIVSLLNNSRGSAVKLGTIINVSMVGSAGTWCARAVSKASFQTSTTAAGTALSLTNLSPALNSQCNCTDSTISCTVDGQNTLVSSDSYSGVSLSGPWGTLSNGSGGISFDPKFGALYPFPPTAVINCAGQAPDCVVLLSKSGKYSTQINVSPLGQVYACAVSGFISGYPSC
jgi:type II secretion system protein H